MLRSAILNIVTIHCYQTRFNNRLNNELVRDKKGKEITNAFHTGRQCHHRSTTSEPTTCQNNVIDAPLCDGIRGLEWLEWVGRRRLGIRFDGTEHAPPSAGISQQHDGSGSTRPAFSDVRALGFLANRVQVQILQRILDLRVSRFFL